MEYGNTRWMLWLSLVMLGFGSSSVPLASAAIVKSTLQAPEITLKDARVIALGFEGVDIELALQVSNPNGQTITVEALNYQFSIEKSTPISGRIQKREVFLAKKKRDVTVSLLLPYGPATSALMQVLSSDERVSYTLKGSVALKGSPKPYLFSHQGILPSLK